MTEALAFVLGAIAQVKVEGQEIESLMKPIKETGPIQ